MNTPPPWLGISTGDWLINSNTPHAAVSVFYSGSHDLP